MHHGKKKEKEKALYLSQCLDVFQGIAANTVRRAAPYHSKKLHLLRYMCVSVCVHSFTAL